MSKVYSVELQGRLEEFLEREGLSQAKASAVLGISQAVLSQYRRSIYEKGDISVVENKLEEFFKIKDEQRENIKKAEPYQGVQNGYVPISTSESAYKLIRYCQLEKGIVVIDGDAGVGKTEAAGKFIQDNPSTTIYVRVSPSTGTVRSLLQLIASELKISETQTTAALSKSIKEKLLRTDKIIIIDEAQHLKYMSVEEIRAWVDKDIKTGSRGIGIVLIGNPEIYDRMLGKQEAIFSQQFSRSMLHGRYRTSNILKEDVKLFFPLLVEQDMKDEINYLYNISHSKWGIRGMVNVYKNAVNNENINLDGLKQMANTMGILLI